MAAFDPAAWVETLQRHRVEYVLVGGYNGTVRGSRRVTMDIDIVPAWTQENLERLCVALRETNAVSTTGPRVEGSAIAPDVGRA